MSNTTHKKMGELRGRKKSKAHQKQSERKVRYEGKKEVENSRKD